MALADTATLVDIARQIGASCAAPAADAVDREARFPREALAALQAERLLGALIPQELGGIGATIADVAAICETLGRSCAATAMIFAMHQINVACLLRHSRSTPFFRDYLSAVAADQRLIASATSEVGTGGDLRRSVCGVQHEPDRRIRISKRCPVISYGDEADDILLTARRAPDATPADQVLVLVRKSECTLTRAGEWDTLGMRGTRSFAYTLEASATEDHLVGVPFADVASQTMIPISHLLWSALWLGLASDAVARARACVRAEARRCPGEAPPSAPRLAQVVADLHTMRALVHDGLSAFERHQDDVDTLAGFGFALRMNNLKLSASRLAPEIVGGALGVCGIAAYRNDSPYSVGRHLRDAYSAALMVGNDRIYSANAAMLLVHKDD
jgi:acyl-CoA dehydrogenase